MSRHGLPGVIGISPGSRLTGVGEEHFIKYQGCQVKECLKCNIAVYQDGYIDCSLVDTLGCTACYQEFEEHMEE